jgi:CO/xanthine dehydrogenase FAD-binding subunit
MRNKQPRPARITLSAKTFSGPQPRAGRAPRRSSYHVTGQGGERRIAARDFYQGAYFTALETGNVLPAVRIPVPPAGHGYRRKSIPVAAHDDQVTARTVIEKDARAPNREAGSTSSGGLAMLAAMRHAGSLGSLQKGKSNPAKAPRAGSRRLDCEVIFRADRDSV